MLPTCPTVVFMLRASGSHVAGESLSLGGAQLAAPLCAEILDCGSSHAAVMNGHLRCLKQLIASSEASFLAVDSEGATPLHLIQHSSRDQHCQNMTTLLLEHSSADDRAAAARVMYNSGTFQGTALEYTLRQQADGSLEGCFGCMHAFLDAGAACSTNGDWTAFVCAGLMQRDRY